MSNQIASPSPILVDLTGSEWDIIQHEDGSITDATTGEVLLPVNSTLYKVTAKLAPVLQPISLEEMKDVYVAYTATFPHEGHPFWDELNEIEQLMACHNYDYMLEALSMIEPA